MITKTNHIGLCVTKMDEMIRFYRDVLGLRQIVDIFMEGKFLDTIQGKDNMKYHIVKFESPDGFIVELLQDHNHYTEEQKEISLQAAGIRHFAFEVDDIDKFYSESVKNKFKTISPPTTSDDEKMRLFYLRDPENNIVEIMQLFD